MTLNGCTCMVITNGTQLTSATCPVHGAAALPPVAEGLAQDALITAAYDFIRAAEAYRIHSELWPSSPIELTVAMITTREKLRSALCASQPATPDLVKQLHVIIAETKRCIDDDRLLRAQDKLNYLAGLVDALSLTGRQ